jgi:hypothetical protein
MKTAGLRITRFPYEEPYHLNLQIEASNGRVTGCLEYYCSVNDLNELGVKLVGYCGEPYERIVYELGSEKAEDRFAFFFSLKISPLDHTGHSVARLRMNNNQLPPETEASEFCIPLNPVDVNRLGRLLVDFARLEHRILDWSINDGTLIKDSEASHHWIDLSRRKPL